MPGCQSTLTSKIADLQSCGRRVYVVKSRDDDDGSAGGRRGGTKKRTHSTLNVLPREDVKVFNGVTAYKQLVL